MPSQADHSSLFILCKVCIYGPICLCLSVCSSERDWERGAASIPSQSLVPSYCPGLGTVLSMVQGHRNEMELSLASLETP